MRTEREWTGVRVGCVLCKLQSSTLANTAGDPSIGGFCARSNGRPPRRPPPLAGGQRPIWTHSKSKRAKVIRTEAEAEAVRNDKDHLFEPALHRAGDEHARDRPHGSAALASNPSATSGPGQPVAVVGQRIRWTHTKKRSRGLTGVSVPAGASQPAHPAPQRTVSLSNRFAPLGGMASGEEEGPGELGGKRPSPTPVPSEPQRAGGAQARPKWTHVRPARRNEDPRARIKRITEASGPEPPKVGEPPSAYAAELEARAAELAQISALRAGTQGNLATALGWLERFVLSTKYQPVRAVNGPTDWAAMLFNENIMASFAVYMSEAKSFTTGEVIGRGTAEGYLSLVRSHFSAVARHPILPDKPLHLKRVQKALRLEAGPADPRKARLPLGAQELRKMPPAPTLATPDGKRWANERAMLILAWHWLLRPGEIAYKGTKGAFDPRWGLTRAHVKFYPQGTAHVAMPHAVMWVLPIKKADGRYQRVPLTVPKEGGPICAYAALEALFRLDPVPEAEAAATPLVRKPNGKNFSPDDMSKVIKREMIKAGASEDDPYSAHSCRIGGACDRRDRGDTEAMIRQAGRWWSDIHEIYARPSVARQIQSALGAYQATGTHIEAVYPGFVQPTFRP